MADITIGNTTIKNPLNLAHNPTKLETYERAIRGNMIINYAVNSEDQPIDKYRWELPGLIDSEMFPIKEEAKKIGNLYLIDYHKIIEVLSGDGSTKTFYTQRIINTLASVTIEVNGIELSIPDDVIVIAYDNVRGELIFDTAPTNVANNIVIKYEPKYAVHIFSYSHVFYFSTIANYTLICEEV